MKYSQLSESQIRSLNICPACLGLKDAGCVVCWDCFKYKEPFPGVPTLKDSGMPAHSWLRLCEQRREAAAVASEQATIQSLQAQ